MPSVKVPPYGSLKWKRLQMQRKKYWKSHGQLTPHFHVSEFHCHDGSYVPIAARDALVALCKIFLEPMRSKYGECTVLSGYRNVHYNASIGGARHSQHIYEETYESVAADVRFAEGSVQHWDNEATAIRATKRKGKGGIGSYLILGFLHVDNRNYKADWSG